MSKDIKKLALLAIAYLCVEIATSPLRGINFIVSSSVMFPVYFLLTFFACKKWASLKPWKILAAAAAGILLPYIVTYTEFPIPGHLDVIIRLLGVLGGMLFFKARTLPRIVIVAISIAFILNFTPLWYGWINYFNYGSFKTTTNVSITRPLILENRTDTVLLDQRPRKIYVLDLWNSYCGYCMQEFPHFQALADKYGDDERIVFYTVDVLERKWNFLTLSTPLRHGCDLPAFFFKDNDFLSSLGINGVPVILVISPTGKVVYRGKLARVEKTIKHMLRGK